MCVRIRSTGAASVTKVTIRMSAPQRGKTTGRATNKRAISMAHRWCTGERQRGASAMGVEAASGGGGQAQRCIGCQHAVVAVAV